MDEKEIIMVVEDSESLNNFIAKNLIEQGFEVIQCFNAKDAYRKLSKNFISLVILDLNLGDDIGGMRVLHSIRLQDKILPVMIVSSINTDKSKVEGFREGCDDYITKPFYFAHWNFLSVFANRKQIQIKFKNSIGIKRFDCIFIKTN